MNQNHLPFQEGSQRYVDISNSFYLAAQNFQAIAVAMKMFLIILENHIVKKFFGITNSCKEPENSNLSCLQDPY